MPPTFFEVGTKIFSKRRGDVLFAKITKVDHRKDPNDPIYTINYYGKSNRYDEKVKHSESSRKFFKSELDVLSEARYILDQASSSSENRPKVERKTNKKSSGNVENSKSDAEKIWEIPDNPTEPTETQKVFREKQLKMPESLKEVLIKSSEMIKYKYLPKLPASFTVAEIIKEYEKSINDAAEQASFHSKIRDNYLNGRFIGIFNKQLKDLLISEFEYSQLEQFKAEKSMNNSEEFKPSEYYGIVPLLRCLEHFLKDKKLNFNYYHLFKDFMTFLRKNRVKYFYSLDYYTLAPSNYREIVPRKRSRRSYLPSVSYTVLWPGKNDLQDSSESESEEDFSDDEEELLIMPDLLKEVLKESSEKIREKYLPKLPAQFTVVDIIKEYESKLGLPAKSDFYLDREKFRKFFWVRFIDMFNRQHKDLLISEFEYFQLAQFKAKKSITSSEEFKPSNYYGIVPLLRCLEHFIKNKIVDYDVKKMVNNFMIFLNRNRAKYFLFANYYEPAPADYQDIVPRKKSRKSVQSTVSSSTSGPMEVENNDLEIMKPESQENLNQNLLKPSSTATSGPMEVSDDDLKIMKPESQQNMDKPRNENLPKPFFTINLVPSPTVPSSTVSSGPIEIEDLSDDDDVHITNPEPQDKIRNQNLLKPSHTSGPIEIEDMSDDDLEVVSTVPSSTVLNRKRPRMYSALDFLPNDDHKLDYQNNITKPSMVPLSTVLLPTAPSGPLEIEDISDDDLEVITPNSQNLNLKRPRMYSALDLPPKKYCDPKPSSTKIWRPYNFDLESTGLNQSADLLNYNLSTVPFSTVPLFTAPSFTVTWNPWNLCQMYIDFFKCLQMYFAMDFLPNNNPVPFSAEPSSTVIRYPWNSQPMVPSTSVIRYPWNSQPTGQNEIDLSKYPNMYSTLDSLPSENPVPRPTVIREPMNRNRSSTSPIEVEDISDDDL